MMETVGLLFLAVAAAMSVTVGLHLVALALESGRGILTILVLAGTLGLWWVAGWLVPAAAEQVVSTLSVRLGVVCLYLALCIIYVELRFLVSRGYSLRVVVDLLHYGGAATVVKLKSDYGSEGVGVEGLLLRRLSDLANLDLLRIEGRHVGPVTGRGRIFVWVTSGARRFLRLENVG